MPRQTIGPSSTALSTLTGSRSALFLDRGLCQPYLAMPHIEPVTFCMQNESSTTEPQTFPKYFLHQVVTLFSTPKHLSVDICLLLTLSGWFLAACSFIVMACNSFIAGHVYFGNFVGMFDHL